MSLSVIHTTNVCQVKQQVDLRLVTHDCGWVGGSAVPEVETAGLGFWEGLALLLLALLLLLLLFLLLLLLLVLVLRRTACRTAQTLISSKLRDLQSEVPRSSRL